METSWERLKKVITWTDLSTHDFAMKIGMKRSESLYRIIQNKEKMGIKLAMSVLDTYPRINRDWLIYGTGEMEDKNPYEQENLIPFYEQAKLEPSFGLLIPIFDADKAKRMTDRAM